MMMVKEPNYKPDGIKKPPAPPAPPRRLDGVRLDLLDFQLLRRHKRHGYITRFELRMKDGTTFWGPSLDSVIELAIEKKVNKNG